MTAAGVPRVPGEGAGGSWLRFLSGPDIDALGLPNAEIVAAVEDAVRAHGEGRVVAEPRVHLVPDNDGAGHFNVLRGHLAGEAGPGVSGVKVVGDFVSNYAVGLPSELGLLMLFDPATGAPLSIMDATLITACRTGAMTAVGARYVDSGRLSADSLHAELGQIVAGRRPGRERPEERILLWHRGLAILDIAVGLAILRRAEKQGAGTMLRYR
jgi:ornithine cyclodeaminase/alanine dehydrogenase-like protein (mu-crystallin family)